MVRQNKENALKGANIKINAINIRPTNTGNIAIDVERETDKQFAVTQINQVIQDGQLEKSLENSQELLSRTS